MNSRTRYLPVLLVAAAALLTFSPILTNDFTWWDDHKTIHQNPSFHPPTWSGIGHYWRHPAMDLYIPVTYTVWGVAAFAGTLSTPSDEGVWLNPAVFHGVNLLAHAISACLAYLILLRLFDRRWIACTAALLFALHPVQVEPVAWASGLKDVLAGLFALAALHQYMLFRVGHRPRLHYFAGMLFLAAAMLSKPSAVVVPLLCAAYDLLIQRTRWRPLLASVLPWIAIAVPVAILARIVQPAPRMMFVPWHHRPLVALDALTFYLGKVCWPMHLGFDYGRTPDVAIGSRWIWATCLVPVVLGAALWISRRRWPRLAFAGCAFLVPLSPVLGLLTFEFQGFSTVADHYLYLAMLGPAVMLGFILSRWPNRTVFAFAIVLLCLLAIRSALQTRSWANDIALCTNAIEVNPRSPVAHGNRAWDLMNKGRYPEARRDARKALELYKGILPKVELLLKQLEEHESVKPPQPQTQRSGDGG